MEPTAAKITLLEDAAARAVRAEQLRRRGLFAYNDGFHERLADVIEVQVRIQDVVPNGDMLYFEDLSETVMAKGPQPTPVDGDIDGQPKPASIPKSRTSDLSFSQAMVRLAGLVSAGFELPPLDESTAQGLSVQERLDLLSEFLLTAPASEGDDGETQGTGEASAARSGQDDQPTVVAQAQA